MQYPIADRIFYNGPIYTMEDDLKKAEAVGIFQDKIVFVGPKEQAKQYADENTQWIDLKGRTLMPGFIESHMHVTMAAEYLLEIDTQGELETSIAELCEQIAQVAKTKKPGEWILGGGWDERFFAEKRLPTRWDLDKVSPNNPVVMRRVCTHKWVVNSLALQAAGIDENTVPIEGGILNKDPITGKLNGIIEENALNMIPVPDYDLSVLKDKMLAIQKDLVAHGVTTVNEITATKQGLRAYQELVKEESALCRVRYWAPAISAIGRIGLMEPILQLGLETGYGNDWLRLMGLKLFSDGTITGKTAGFSEGFIDMPFSPDMLIISDEEMLDIFRKAAQANLRVALHALGDASIAQIIRNFSIVNKEKNITHMRNRIEHCGCIKPEQMDQMRELGLVASLSTGFIYPLGDHYNMVLPKEKVQKLYPAKSLMEKGVVVSGNADCPICNFNPFESIFGAVTRTTQNGMDFGQDEAITVEQGLKMYTINAAKACCDEAITGSLRCGKYADMMILEKDPFAVSMQELYHMQVLATFTNGQLVYGDLQSL